jgi:hypothetical protein
MIAAKLAKTAVEEPLVTVQLLNEIRKYCNGCGRVSECPTAKSAAALESCELIDHAIVVRSYAQSAYQLSVAKQQGV